MKRKRVGRRGVKPRRSNKKRRKLNWNKKKPKYSQYKCVSYKGGASKPWLARKTQKGKNIINKSFETEYLAALALDWACEENGLPKENGVGWKCYAHHFGEGGGCRWPYKKNEASSLRKWEWIKCSECALWWHKDCSQKDVYKDYSTHDGPFVCYGCNKLKPGFKAPEVTSINLVSDSESEEEMEGDTEPADASNGIQQAAEQAKSKVEEPEEEKINWGSVNHLHDPHAFSSDSESEEEEIQLHQVLQNKRKRQSTEDPEEMLEEEQLADELEEEEEEKKEEMPEVTQKKEEVQLVPEIPEVPQIDEEEQLAPEEATSQIMAPFDKWTTQGVATWLRSRDWNIAENHIQNFIDEDIDGATLLKVDHYYLKQLLPRLKDQIWVWDALKTYKPIENLFEE